MRFFGLILFHESTPNRSLMIRGKSELSVDYTAERHAFPGHNSRKVKTFRGLYRGKACLSAVYSTERHVIANYSASRQAFPW
jgi:hypothetical protein